MIFKKQFVKLFPLFVWKKKLPYKLEAVVVKFSLYILAVLSDSVELRFSEAMFGLIV